MVGEGKELEERSWVRRENGVGGEVRVSGLRKAEKREKRVSGDREE